MTGTLIEVRAAQPRAQVTMSAGAGTVLVPRLLDRTSTSVHLALVAGGAMLLGGDELTVTISVGDGCQLELTEVGGMVAYGASGVRSHWNVDIALQRGSRLLWHGRETVVAEGADLTRTLTMTMANDSCAVIRETTVLGRWGETGGRARLRSRITREMVPVLIEDLDVSGDRPQPGVWGANRVFDTVLIVGRRPAADCGAFALAEPGALARRLTADLHDSPLTQVWAQWRDEVVASAPVESISAEDGRQREDEL